MQFVARHRDLMLPGHGTGDPYRHPATALGVYTPAPGLPIRRPNEPPIWSGLAQGPREPMPRRIVLIRSHEPLQEGWRQRAFGPAGPLLEDRVKVAGVRFDETYHPVQ